MYLIALFKTYYASDDGERFTTIDYRHSLEITDWEGPGQRYLVDRAKLEHLNFSVAELLAEAERFQHAPANRAFPSMGEEDDEHPAINWLEI
jgi:hypothetical protein